MSYWLDFEGWKERHRELVWEAERGRLARRLRRAREGCGTRSAGMLRGFIAFTGAFFGSFSRVFRG